MCTWYITVVHTVCCPSLHGACYAARMTSDSARNRLRERRRKIREEPLPDARDQLLAAAERVLEETPLHDVSVARIYEEAGVSRATFYSYFASKYEILVALHGSVIERLSESFRPFFDASTDIDPDETIATALSSFGEVARQHWGISRAVHEHWHESPELGTLAHVFAKQFTDDLAAEIDRQRDLGIAIPGLDSAALASTLFWCTEHMLYVGLMGVDPNLPEVEDVLEPLVAIWTQAIYGRGPRTSREDRDARRSTSTTL